MRPIVSNFSSKIPHGFVSVDDYADSIGWSKVKTMDKLKEMLGCGQIEPKTFLIDGYPVLHFRFK